MMFLIILWQHLPLILHSNFFDGKLDSVANVYNFNIPSFVQSYLNDATGNVKPEVEILSEFRNFKCCLWGK
jgi:hypothetical protein